MPSTSQHGYTLRDNKGKPRHMKPKQPRHPIAIIGAGIAGLAAAHILSEAQVPFYIIERFDRPGGRLNTRQGQDWTADHGTCYIHSTDLLLGDLIRSVGMETERVTVQGAVHRLTADLQIERPEDGGIDGSRVCLEPGFSALAVALAGRFDVRYNMPIGAIRWDNSRKTFWWDAEGQVFWFEDEDGTPWRDAVSHRVLSASGVILATTGTAARRIVEKSPALSELEPLLEPVAYTGTFTAVFKVPRLRTAWYALAGKPGSPFAWIGLEERKTSGRVAPEHSLLVVHCESVWSSTLLAMDRLDALNEVYSRLRIVVPELPETPLSQTYKRWNVARVTSDPVVSKTDRPRAQWPVNPPTAPFALAGDYVYGHTAEDAAQSGRDAALALLAQLPERRTLLGLELAN